jgi:hypothetical protein
VSPEFCGDPSSLKLRRTGASLNLRIVKQEAGKVPYIIYDIRQSVINWVSGDLYGTLQTPGVCRVNKKRETINENYGV